MKWKSLLILFPVLVAVSIKGQNYSAVHGSNYFGSLGVYNNPSTIVNSPYKWDLTLLGLQYQSITNALRGPNFPLNLSPTASFTAAQGNFKRFADVNFNLRLLNARYSIDKTHAFAFGVNVRTYTQALTSKLNYTDSVQGPRSFLFLNEQNRTLDVDLAASAWMEVYGSYGLTIFDKETGRLNAGATLKIQKGMAGGFVKVNDVGIESETRNDEVIYKIADGDGRYGYSSNLGDGESFSADNLFSGAKTGLAIDLGVEYLVKSQNVTNVYEENTDNDYEWKIGFSLLDLGWNNFDYSPGSRAVSSLNNDVSNLSLNQKFSSVNNLNEFNDSLSTIVNNYEILSGKFKIMNPARVVINADRYVSGNVFVNAELNVSLAAGKNNNVAVREARLVTVTPRWESSRWGFFVPVQYTRHGNFWIGGAVKAGPLLLGTHNLLNAFLKNKNLAGGAYLAITLRPSSFIRDARNRQYECPTY